MSNNAEYTEQQAKEYVIKTILTGDSKRISEVISHFQKAYGKSRSNENEQVKIAEEIFKSK